MVSFDDSYLFTVGLDGALIIYSLNEEQYKIKLDKDGMGHSFADEFLIPREKYKQKIVKIERLKQEYNELTMKQEMKMHLHLKDRDEKIRELEENIGNLQRTEKEKYNQLLDGKRKMEHLFDD